MSEDELKEAIEHGMSTAGTVAKGVALGTSYAMEGGAAGGASAAANTLLAGGEIAGGAAAGGVVFAAASVVGAAATGYKIGTAINEATGASEKYAHAVNEADPAMMVDAGKHWESALEEAAKGDSIASYVDAVLSVGGLAVAADEAVIDKVETAAADVEDAAAHLGADILTDIL